MRTMWIKGGFEKVAFLLRLSIQCMYLLSRVSINLQFYEYKMPLEMN